MADNTKEKKVEEKVEEKPKKTTKKKTTTKKTTKRTTKKRKKNKSVVARGKRKTAIARASVKPGKGNVRVNKSSVSSINNLYLRNLIMEPVTLAAEKASKVDISVSVIGGGVFGQAQAVRTAIAKALVSYFDDESLKKLMNERDRSLLIEDSRRVESKKFKGPKARARYQKSYR